jgi:site-specific recombinase XerC
LGTQDNYKKFGKHLKDFFGGDKKIASITKFDCERFHAALKKKLSSSSVSRYFRACRSIFKFAVDSDRLSKNPFVGIASGIEVNPARQVYVDRKTICRVMSCCRDDYDRLLLALARFGGLRIPSEIRQLRFCDFAGDVIRIHPETKTGSREVPLFGEIREILSRLVNLGKEPADSSRLIFGDLGDFRRRIISAIRAAGVERWTKLFVNLRSSCITDFVERGYQEKTLDAIFGNSSVIRSRHYIQFRKDKEYAKVLRDDARLLALLREGVDEDDISLREVDDLLVLRDLLVSRFGTGKKAV